MGHYLKEWIEAAGLKTQEALAPYVLKNGKPRTKSQISEWLTGKTNITLRDLEAIAEGFNRFKPELDLEPVELLMHPDKVERVRRLLAHDEPFADLTDDERVQLAGYADFLRSRRAA